MRTLTTVTEPDPASVHRVQQVGAFHAGAEWQASITCYCGRWTLTVGPYGTEYLARRVARGYQRRHRRLAQRGVLTVTDGLPGHPEMVAVPEDEEAFMREAARAVLVPPRLGHLPPGELEVFAMPVVIPTDLELHEATLADLELLGEPMTA